MGYNRELDETVWEKEVNISDPYGQASTKFKFVVSVMRYAGGKPKVDIKRLAYGAGKKGVYCKLGRFSEYELEKLIPALQDARMEMI